MNSKLIKTSKLLSLVLRHDPGAIGIELDPQGWIEIDVLLAAMAKHQRGIDRQTLDEVVARNEKKRFAISDDGRRIRASQGHSVEVDLGLEAMDPPGVLYHGTATRFMGSILEKGLIPGARQHVHLSADVATARRVGARHGKPVIVEIDCQAMRAAGVEIFLSANGVWLTAKIPPEFLRVQA